MKRSSTAVSSSEGSMLMLERGEDMDSINIEPSDDDTTDEDLFMLLPVRMKD